MATAQVKDFRLSWHPQKGGVMEYHLIGSTQYYKMPLSTQEFAAAAALLRWSPVYVTNGWLHTGPEPANEAL